MRECLAFDDVLLEPVYSDIRSRMDTDTRTDVGGLKLQIPLISSPMDTVTESKMAIAIGKLGGLGVLHRFMTIQNQISMGREIINNGVYFVPAVGVTESERRRFLSLYDAFGKSISMISVDVANGYHILMKEMIEFIKSIDADLPIMAGNVATTDGYKYLADLGVNAVRIGIGGGSICKTRIQSSFGIPTLQSVLDCVTVKDQYKASLIADGGIKYPADLVKSLAAGADAIIAGGLFAGTKEAPGNIIYTNDGKAWKSYRGMASAEVQIDKRGGLKPGTVAEGVSTLVPYKGSLERVVNEFVGGLRSGMTYGNARTIPDLRKINMVRVTNSGMEESHAYGTKR